MQKKKTQGQIVIETIEKLGGTATLGLLTQESLKDPNFKFNGKTPAANIRRIVQNNKEIYKIKPGLYSLEKLRKENEEKGLLVETAKNKNSKDYKEFTHGYYQGILISLGNLQNYETYSPNQDNNRLFTNNISLKDIRTLEKIPDFSYDTFVKRSKTIDTIWFRKTLDHLMPKSYFEVEHSTDIQNSLLKFLDLRDFASEKYIVADSSRQKEIEAKMRFTAFNDLKGKVRFWSYDLLDKKYQHFIDNSNQETEIIL